MKTRIPSLKEPLAAGLSILLVFVLGAVPARADERSPGEAPAAAAAPAASASGVPTLSEEGFALYKAKDYRHAAEKFLQAYALEQDSNLLFNLARCYEALGDTDNAIEKYQAFIAKPDADPQGKQRATDALRALRQAKATAATATAAPATTAGGAPPAPNDLPVAATNAGAAPPKSSFLSAPVVTLGSGVIVAAAGAVFYAMGVSDHNKVTGSPGYGTTGQVDTLTESQAHDLVQSGNTKKLIGVIGLGVGGALLVTSAVLFALDTHSGGSTRETATVAWGVAPAKGGGQVLWEGRF